MSRRHHTHSSHGHTIRLVNYVDCSSLFTPQEYFGITPDLTTMGKVIGGGLPVGAYGGRADIMQMVAPAGPMYQAGTLSGNPLAMTAGIKVGCYG